TRGCYCSRSGSCNSAPPPVLHSSWPSPHSHSADSLPYPSTHTHTPRPGPHSPLTPPWARHRVLPRQLGPTPACSALSQSPCPPPPPTLHPPQTLPHPRLLPTVLGLILPFHPDHALFSTRGNMEPYRTPSPPQAAPDLYTAPHTTHSPPFPTSHNYHLSCSFPIMADLWHLCPGKQDPWQRRKWRGTMVLLRLAWERTLPQLLTLRAIIQKLTQLLAFELFILTVIGIHTTVLVVQTFAVVQVRGEWFFSAMDAVFLCMYVLEALLKLIALDLNYFRNPWNDIDFFVMIMMVLDFVLPLLISPGHTTHDNAGSLFRVLRVFKCVRAVRVLRLLLTLRSVRHWEVLGSQHCCSLPPHSPVMFSVVLHDLFQNSDPYRFGELFDTIFTLFQLFTLDDWSFIYLDSIQGGPWCSIPMLGGNLVIAVLVDNFQLALIKRQELQKQKGPWQEGLWEVAPLGRAGSDPGEVTVPHPSREKQLLFTYLQLMASVEHLQQQFRSQAATTDKIVDSFFETAEQDFPHH
uniref:Ion transport domain-containing protein n=1 Tax=Gopherus evgoodei TaxID=1825980 RepID=A0A8C4WD67_9SAUR